MQARGESATADLVLPGAPRPGAARSEDFERIARLVVRVLNVPAALVTLVEDGRETVAAGVGVPSSLAAGTELLLARDLPARGREAGRLPLRRAGKGHAAGAAALAGAGVAACLACPVRDASGALHGTLAALEFRPRRWGRGESAVLDDLAVFAGHEVERRAALSARMAVAEALDEAKRALSGAEDLRGLVEQPLVGLFIMEGGRIRWANAELGRILGYTLEEIRAMDAPEDMLLEGEDRERLLSRVAELAAEESVHVCTVARRRDASLARVEMRVSHLAVGDRFVVVGAVQDVSGTADDDLALRDDAARFRRVFEDDISGAVVAAPDCRIIACNREFARIAGFPYPEAAVGVELDRLEPQPGEWSALVDRLRRGGGTVEPGELELQRRDGTRARVVAQLAADFGTDGRPLEYRAYLIDVTQRALREEALRQSHERLRLLELATNDVTWDWNLATGRVSWNEAAPRRFRYDPREVRSSLEWHLERVHPDDRERIVAGLHQAISGLDDAWTDEYRFLRGDGTYGTVHDRAYVMRNARGEPVRVTGWMVDVTERKRSEESQRFLARASAMLDSSLDVEVTASHLARLCIPQLADFCVVDLVEDGGDLRRVAAAHVRPSRERLLQREGPVRVSSGDAQHPLLAVAGGGDPVLCTLCDDAQLRDLDRVLGEGTARRLGAHSYMVVPVEAHERVLATLVLGLSQTGRRFDPMDLIVARDLAHRAALALENARLYETAQHALRAREEVLGVVSHDLRGPLSTIVTMAVLLCETSSERREEMGRWLDVIRRAADQMNRLIGDLLDVSSIEARRFAVEPERYDLGRLLRDTCEQLRPLAETQDQRLECTSERDLPHLELDVRQVVRVIGNLVGNAIKFTPAGGTIRMRAAAVGDEVQVSITDTGPGIPADQLPRVFDRFWKARRGDRRGTGLGLTIARGIVEAHGGRIWVESREGEGSTFTFALPVRGARVPALPAPRPHQPA